MKYFYDFIKILLTTIPTVIAGTIVYAITKFIIDNFLELRSIKGDISSYLFYYANVYGGAPIKDDKLKMEASDKFRFLAARLSSIVERRIPFYNLISKIFNIIPLTNIEEAVRKLTFLHNTIPTFSTIEESRVNRKEAEDIKQLLNLKNNF
jgi:hypothetical protein